MNESEFEEWCTRRESKLLRYKVAEIIETSIVVIFLLLVFGLGLILNYIFMKFIVLSTPTFLISFFLGIIIAAVVVILTLRFFKYPMNKIEYISCLLNKIANDVKILDESDLKSDLKLLKKHTKFFLFGFPDEHLFIEDINKQKEFYESLENLPIRLLYKLENDSLKEIEHDDIKKLGFYIHEDSTEKIDILKKIIDKYPDELPPPLKSVSPVIEKVFAYNLPQLALMTLLLLSFTYFILFKYIEVGKDTAAIIFTMLGIFIWGMILKRPFGKSRISNEGK